MTTAPQTPAPTPAGEGSVGAGQTRTFDHTDMAILEFERAGTWSVPGLKDRDILDQFAMTPTSYYIRLNWILNQPEAVAYDPVTVGRLQRLRDLRRAVRTRGATAAGVATRPDPRGVRPALLGGVVR